MICRAGRDLKELDLKIELNSVITQIIYDQIHVSALKNVFLCR